VCTDTGCCSHSTVMIGLPATPAASYLATLEGEKQLELPLFIPLSLFLFLLTYSLTHSLNSTLFVHISFTLSSSVFSLSLESFFLCFLPTLSPFAHLSALFSVCISLSPLVMRFTITLLFPLFLLLSFLSFYPDFMNCICSSLGQSFLSLSVFYSILSSVSFFVSCPHTVM